MQLQGTPSDHLPDVLATGETSVNYVYISLSARDQERRDAEYIEWHSLDHRPEQYRVPEIRNALRLVSTPDCRAARAASTEPYDRADHVMTYQFTDASGMPAFQALGAALHEAGRMPLRLPHVGFVAGDLAGKAAAARAVAGADVIPWRPMLGVYLLIERGEASPAPLLDVPGVAGVWWYKGRSGEPPSGLDAEGVQITYCYLDEDPVSAAPRLGEAMQHRWASGRVGGLLAAPFYPITPFEWRRYLPH